MTVLPQVVLRYRTSLEVARVTIDGRPRIQLCDPETENEVRLGPVEYRVASLFDGARTLEDISQVLAEEDGLNCPPHKVALLAERLMGYGIVEVLGGRRLAVQPNPFTGLEAGGKFHRFLVIRLLELPGDAWLRRLLARAPILGTRLCLAACMAFVLVTVGVLIPRWGEFAHDMTALDPTIGRFWILLIVLGNAANVLHELAHAIACRAQGVRVMGMGWVLHYFLLGAWVRPSKTWRELSRARRMICVLAGPLVSVVVSSAGVWLWLATDGVAAEVGLLLALSSIVGAVITLVPVHTGDGYVILTDLLEMPDLRQRALRYLRVRLERKQAAQERPRHQVLLVAFAVTAVTWRAVLVCALLWAAWHVPVTFGGWPVPGILVSLFLYGIFRRLAAEHRRSP